MTHKRSKYIIESSREYLQSTPGAEKKRVVFADEIQTTGTGDAVFSQVRDSVMVTPEGERTPMTRVATMVLYLKSETFNSITQVGDKDVAMYHESGRISLETSNILDPKKMN